MGNLQQKMKYIEILNNGTFGAGRVTFKFIFKFDLALFILPNVTILQSHVPLQKQTNKQKEHQKQQPYNPHSNK